MNKQTAKKYLDNYNSHDWQDFVVSKPEQTPKGPHFGAVLFEKEKRYETDHYQGGTHSRQVIVTTYFAFPDKSTLGEWVLRATKDNKHFFFFEVKQLGTAQLKISVDLGV